MEFNKPTLAGLIIFALGLIILTGYGIYLDFNAVETIDPVILISGGAVLLGGIIMLVSIFFEQQKNKKQCNEKLNKEDLRP